MLTMRNALPPGCNWSAFGISRHQFPMVAQAVVLGGQVRVGLEDNLYLSRGVLAPGNAALVERAARIIGELGAEVATPDQARESWAWPRADPSGGAAWAGVCHRCDARAGRNARGRDA
jgi:uncharacterized protein (DUF849 family)